MKSSPILGSPAVTGSFAARENFGSGSFVGLCRSQRLWPKLSRSFFSLTVKGQAGGERRPLSIVPWRFRKAIAKSQTLIDDYGLSCFISYIINMNRGSLYTRSFRSNITLCQLDIYRLIKFSGLSIKLPQDVCLGMHGYGSHLAQSVAFLPGCRSSET